MEYNVFREGKYYIILTEETDGAINGIHVFVPTPLRCYESNVRVLMETSDMLRHCQHHWHHSTYSVCWWWHAFIVYKPFCVNSVCLLIYVFAFYTQLVTVNSIISWQITILFIVHSFYSCGNRHSSQTVHTLFSHVVSAFIMQIYTL